ncbi:MAG: hypothetical protein IJF76_02810 [Clostridia bacterium]|nr:hypothetical protein [Clostridia bacterium]
MIISFFGHKNTLLSQLQYEYLCVYLENLIKENQKCVFYLGGYGSFDNTCLKILKKLKCSYPNIELVFITPYLRENYTKLKIAKETFDDVIYPPIENVPLRFAISKRNEWIVSVSDFIFVFISHNFGGAYSAYSHALKKKVPTINLFDIK